MEAVVTLRPLEPDDGQLLRGLFDRLSPTSRYMRFLSPVQRAEQVQVQRLLDIDHADREAVAALVEGEVVGVARYARLDTSTAEFAVTVADDWQRHGIGSALLERLAAAASGRGVTRLKGVALGENRRILALLRHVFPAVSIRLQDGLVEIEVDLEGRPPAEGQQSASR